MNPLIFFNLSILRPKFDVQSNLYGTLRAYAPSRKGEMPIVAAPLFPYLMFRLVLVVQYRKLVGLEVP